MSRDTLAKRWSRTKRRVAIRGQEMAFVDVGRGDPIVFLHGCPTSSFLWRDIIPHVQDLGRCIAPDLMGFGDSARLPPGPPDRYRLADQRAYLDALLDTLQVRRNVTLVLHDWGSVLGFDWARRNAAAIRAIAYMEAVVRPTSRDDLDAGAVTMFETLRSGAGEKLILEDNMYVEQALPQMILRKLSDEEMDGYRAPFRVPGESRRAILTLCREVPFDGTPRDVWDMEAAYAAWLPDTTFPKLFVNAEPGAFLVGAKRDLCRTWKNQDEVTVRGLHFLQEDSPDAIGEAIANWLRKL